MRLSRDGTQLFQGFDTVKYLKFVFYLIAFASNCFGIAIVGFTRKDFGERYYSWINLFFGYTVVANFAFLGNVLSVASGHRFSWLMLAIWVAFIAISLFHRHEISAKNKAGALWHSQYHGTSLLPEHWGRERILKLFEPGLTFLLGLLIWKFSGTVGIWLMASGTALLINNYLVAYFEREKILDARDAGIEARYMGKALEGRPATETGGFIIADSNRRTIAGDDQLKDIFARLSDEAKARLDEDSDAGGIAA